MRRLGILALLVALMSTLLSLSSQPANAATARIGDINRGRLYAPGVIITLNRAQSGLVGQAAFTGVGAFTAQFCKSLPGKSPAASVAKAGCAGAVSVAYYRVVYAARNAYIQRRCLRVYYPLAFPTPNGARVVNCR